ncbi:hypothetical protein LTR96_010897 [Exophiala xenobiotica]|nr:hypothetical protein LTR92_010743 [Exophiala xenobiotica]KAK5203289.1 hypothetical protein LTR41_011013 [Exophiala xenobiotica]KAK5215628.1 hypothetical protein LTR72_011342 [Exophiala xenobiotica]KAK5220247.1 hypothetical protein LTR47_011331 [Exophiala xenobiotica]KAK5244467.1 hypothetical protein LTS06_009951 [Exophiala xenobiotica]
MALLDESATDWKVIVIDINDSCAGEVHDLDDIQEHFPGLLDATRDWFKLYKVGCGKQANKVALNEQLRDQHYAMSTVQECQRPWEKLIDGEESAGEISVIRGNESDGFLDIDTPRGDDGHQSPEENRDIWFFLNK